MRAPTIHYNPQDGSGRTRCGRKLADVQHRKDRFDSSCNNCVRLIKLDMAREKR